MNTLDVTMDSRNIYDLIREFSQTLRLVRLSKKMSVSELAKRTGRSNSFIYMLERGCRALSYNTYCRLLTALELEGNDLVAFKTAARDILVHRTLYGRKKEPYVRRSPTSAEVAMLKCRDRLVVQASEAHRAELAREILALRFDNLPKPTPVSDADRGEPPVFDNTPAPLPNWLAR